ncbi:MAG: glucose-1-phosphate adenylyltransferase subunit GlgD [Clostridia bacterium]|nr:glucose-1-phosphate adenylyltransferase subunit GlgD [Clostridia bacterium]MDE6211420.1 glucose-1-phosphate adenylyltransferase subunit GlgD [Clostridia bacterium]MDE6606101.1 glucose-1-phosphate adenylyltransferase subunit GlgD [Clostridia bacterium]MDE6870182.1 glucose-1-phosphate adenylyltransferase subunit GlgD [Clostridia bacterium]
MNNAMSIIFASDNESKLNELTLHRTTASLPFGGRYRCIDFALSNLVNSSITTIGIITRNNYSSLMDHIRMGRDWDLNRKNSGIVVFPPYASNTSTNVFKGKIEALYGILDYIESSDDEYVVVTNSNIIASIDFDDVYESHVASGADITMLTYNAQPTTSRRVIVESDLSGRVRGMKITRNASEDECELGLFCYLFNRKQLIQLVSDSYERGKIDFERDILQSNIDILNIHAYKVKGHAALVDDIKSYYRESMAILDTDVRNSLFDSAGKVFTKVKDSVPTRYYSGATVVNSLIADGCKINGRVENSILFRGVVVEEGAEVVNSIVMESGKIMKGSTLNFAITDKNVTVTEDKSLSGSDAYPVVVVKNKTV